jgi:hypothetical protein
VTASILGLPSVHSIVEGVVKFFFGTLAKLLVPGFLKHASITTIKWLVAVPDPTTWAHVSQLRSDMSYIAVSLLGVSFTAAIVRYLLVGLTGSGSPLEALGRTLISALGLVLYSWAVHELVAMVNTLTNGILSYPVVGEGLQRTVGIMFGGSLLVGSGGVFLALLVIVGVVLAAVLFAFKILVLLAFALAFVTGESVIAMRPVPELAHLSRAWMTTLVGIALVPLGWTILFAVAGALSLDATSAGAVGHTGLLGGLTAHVAGVFAALLTFFLAIKLPLGVLGHLRGALGGPGGQMRGGASGAGGRGVRRQARLSAASARLRAGTLEAGRVVGLAAGAAGAPRGGPLGAGLRAGARRGAPLAASGALAVGIAEAGARADARRWSQTRTGRALTRSRTVRAVGGRLAAAGRVLASGPALVGQAAHSNTGNPTAAPGKPAKQTGEPQTDPRTEGRSPQQRPVPRGKGSATAASGAPPIRTSHRAPTAVAEQGRPKARPQAQRAPVNKPAQGVPSTSPAPRKPAHKPSRAAPGAPAGKAPRRARKQG